MGIYIDLSIYISFFLAFLVPALSFSSVNTQFFTRSQIINSLCVAAFTGLILGAGAIWASSQWQYPWLIWLLFLLPIICFFLLSERFFTETIPNIYARIGLEAGIMAFCGLCVWLDWYFVIPALLGIYGFFAAYDLYKNWQRAKTPIFDPDLVKPVPEPVENIKFNKRPNVYLLLLESLHSSEALEKVYGIKTSAAEDCFRKHGLTVYPGTFSNKHSTPLSLRTLLSMSLDFKAPPLVLEHFVRNGYQCYFFDSMYYLSQPYIKYIANENSKMPFWVYHLYSIMGPVLAQSRWLRKLAGNIDPFETTAPNRTFEAMLSDFQTHLLKSQDTPSFNILHFGASHFGGMWYRHEKPQETYLHLYNKAIDELETVLDEIITHDSDAMIVAVGDHGAYHWVGVTEGSDLPERNAMNNGVSMEALAQDFFGVALGIRWAASQLPAVKVLSHVNIFRWVMAILEGKDAPSHEEENISIFQGKCVLVRGGVPLERFEALPNGAYADYYSDAIDPALMDATMRLEMSLLKNDFSNLSGLAKDVITKAEHTSFFTDQHKDASQILIKAGFVSEGVELINSYWSDFSEKFTYSSFFHLVQCHLSLGNNSLAENILIKGLLTGNYPKHGSIRYLMQALARQNKYKDALLLIPKLFSTPQDLNYEPVLKFTLETATSILILERAKDHAAAEVWLDEQLEINKGNMEYTNILRIQKILLLLKYNHNEARAKLYEYFKNGIAFPGLLLLALRLAIEADDMAEANALFNTFENIPALRTNPYRFLYGEELIKKGTPAHISLISAKSLLSAQIQCSGCFDENWYQKTYEPSLPPVMDYLKNGLILLRNPNQSFDTFFYLCSQPAAIIAGIDSLNHYIDMGAYAPVSLDDEPFIRNMIHPALREELKETA